MNSIYLVERRPLPEKIKIVNEANIVTLAHRPKPCVEAINFTEPHVTAVECRNRPNIKSDVPHCSTKSKSFLKTFLTSSEGAWATSFDATCIMILVTDNGKEGMEL